MTAHSVSPDLPSPTLSNVVMYGNLDDDGRFTPTDPGSAAIWDRVRAALQASPAPEPRKGYVLDYDAEYRWLVMSDPEGASEIVARDVRASDAPYLIAGYERLAATPSEPEPPALDVLRHDVESLRATAHEQMTTGGALASAAFFEGAVVAYDEVLRRLATPAPEEAPE